MAEMVLNTMVLVSWRHLKYIAAWGVFFLTKLFNRVKIDAPRSQTIARSFENFTRHSIWSCLFQLVIQYMLVMSTNQMYTNFKNQWWALFSWNEDFFLRQKITFRLCLEWWTRMWQRFRCVTVYTLYVTVYTLYIFLIAYGIGRRWAAIGPPAARCLELSGNPINSQGFFVRQSDRWKTSWFSLHEAPGGGSQFHHAVRFKWQKTLFWIRPFGCFRERSGLRDGLARSMD